MEQGLCAISYLLFIKRIKNKEDKNKFIYINLNYFSCNKEYFINYTIIIKKLLIIL